MTPQEVFDKVAKHLLTQKKAALASNGSCQYRTASGLSCAVGCLIPDDVYVISMENKAARSFLDEHGDDVPELVPHRRLLLSLQLVHDHSPPSIWASRLQETAHNHGLNDGIIKGLV